jgi:ABC-type glycerol-3-phosphate transport system substrate-binding protein
MSRRFCLYLIPVIALLSVAAASCAPPAPTGPGAPAATQAPAAPAATEAPAASGAIQFFTWAEDDFEQRSLEQLVKSFKLPVNLDVVR